MKLSRKIWKSVRRSGDTKKQVPSCLVVHHVDGSMGEMSIASHADWCVRRFGFWSLGSLQTSYLTTTEWQERVLLGYDFNIVIWRTGGSPEGSESRLFHLWFPSCLSAPLRSLQRLPSPPPPSSFASAKRRRSRNRPQSPRSRLRSEEPTRRTNHPFLHAAWTWTQPSLLRVPRRVFIINNSSFSDPSIGLLSTWRQTAKERAILNGPSHFKCLIWRPSQKKNGRVARKEQKVEWVVWLLFKSLCYCPALFPQAKQAGRRDCFAETRNIFCREYATVLPALGALRSFEYWSKWLWSTVSHTELITPGCPR